MQQINAAQNEATMHNITICYAHSWGEWDTRCDENSSWHHGIMIDPSARRVWPWSTYGDGVPAKLYNGIWTVVDLPNNCSGKDILKIVKSHECMELLSAICDDYVETYWDGHRWCGRWGAAPDSDKTSDLTECVSELFDGLPTYWDAGEWIDGNVGGVLRDACAALAAGTSLKDWASRECAEALPDSLVDDDDLCEAVLSEVRDSPERLCDDGEYMVGSEKLAELAGVTLVHSEEEEEEEYDDNDDNDQR